MDLLSIKDAIRDQKRQRLIEAIKEQNSLTVFEQAEKDLNSIKYLCEPCADDEYDDVGFKASIVSWYFRLEREFTLAQDIYIKNDPHHYQQTVDNLKLLINRIENALYGLEDYQDEKDYFFLRGYHLLKLKCQFLISFYENEIEKFEQEKEVSGDNVISLFGKK